MRPLLLLFTLLFISTSTLSQTTESPSKSPFEGVEKSDLFLLGTFHFKDAGLDGYKPQYDVDILSEERQEELQEVLEIIGKYKPTKIAVEWQKTRQAQLDSLYDAYLAGRFELTANEIYQIGFRMAKALGHDKVYAIDARPRSFDDGLTDEEYEEKVAYFTEKLGAPTVARDEDLHNRFMAMYAADDVRKTQVSLLDQLLGENDPEGLRISHGHYLIGDFRMNEGDEYLGADGAIWWYTRNLRIFANILGITNPGQDKVFVLIGSGHLPILNFLANSSPDYRMVTLQELVK
ncbi:hypothetical protein FK220_011630 [Flavobacteriaceae bacterium TP-CH-4]|uniref:TraB/GumN family protein n=1 Tax=Pelagihabitans pacificus TaxID=2696054 RepID=A0A967B0R0_9FLAO|nr:DUF5694 domain-containing protein [Pelagihabitans pacificus]NHF59996.1 hypothetical protein [Pelagihabitans pacificus]